MTSVVWTDIWQNMMLDNIYRSPIAVNAELTSAGGAVASVRICDETKGTAIAGGPGQVESVRPTCRVRASELVQAGIALGDLPDSSIVFNQQTWRVKASQMHPTPMGELAGEVMLILLSDN